MPSHLQMLCSVRFRYCFIACHPCDCYGIPLPPKLSDLVLGFEAVILVFLLSLVVLRNLYAIETIFFDVSGL